MERRARLLVHAGAPSSRQHDEHRAAQAAAYLELNPMRVAKVISFRASDALPGPTLEPSTVTQSLQSSTFIEDTQMAYTALDTQLFTSSGIAKGSPAAQSPLKATKSARSTATELQVPKHTTLNQDVPHHSSQGREKRERGGEAIERISESASEGRQTPALRRTVSDPSGSGNSKQYVFNGPESQSSYLPSPNLVRQKKRTHRDSDRSHSNEQPLEHAGSSLIHGDGLASIWTVSKSVVTRKHCDSGDGTVTTSETTSEMPTSYSLSDDAAGSLNHRSQVKKRPPTDFEARTDGTKVCPDPHANLQASCASNNPDKSLIAARTSRSPSPPVSDASKGFIDGANAGVLKHSTLLTLPSQQAFPQGNRHLQAQEALRSASEEIRAPPPETSIKPFETHLTSMLRNLSEDPAFRSLYQPVIVSRQLEIHERGYWLIDWSTWPATSQLDFWLQMETLIGSGNAGWGVWCQRNVLDGSSSLDSVKVWCWGEIVKPIYLLLYTMSMGKVRKLGLRWIDSGGMVVVQMKEGKISG